MKQKFEKSISFEIVAMSEDVMTYDEAVEFAKGKGGRLPEPAEMMVIWDNLTYEDNLPILVKGAFVNVPNNYFRGKEVGYSYPNTLGLIMPYQNHTCGVIVVKDVEE